MSAQPHVHPSGTSDPAGAPTCWLARHGVMEGTPEMPPCQGQLVRAHLLPKQMLLKHLKPEVATRAILDPRSWVWACGGPMGDGGHHGMLDRPAVRALRIPRREIPSGTEFLACQLGLTWWLDQRFGARA